ncbi:hypothetical protein Hanom_Chr01g00089771 [Helianthus anomalus]
MSLTIYTNLTLKLPNQLQNTTEAHIIIYYYIYTAYIVQDRDRHRNQANQTGQTYGRHVEHRFLHGIHGL